MQIGLRYSTSLALVLANGTPVRAQQPIAGNWAGGYRQGHTYLYIQPSFRDSSGALTGSASIPLQLKQNLPLEGLSWDGRRLSFTVTERAGRRTFQGELRGDTVLGEVEVDGTRLPFHLVRLVPLAAEGRRRLVGLYQRGDGGVIGIAGGGEIGLLTYMDFQSGTYRGLYPTSDSAFFAGPGWFAPYPRELEVTFSGVAAGRPTEVVVWEGGKSQSARRFDSYREEEVSFRNGDVTLAGRLVLPPEPGPHPAVVFVHGSGPARRGGPFLLDYYFARRGIASLSYDKRGVGQSTGTYTHNVNAEEFAKLAGDALAGVALLRTRPEIDPRRIGFWGISQAGWIIALAAAQSSDVAFSVVVSGAAVSLGEEGYFSELTGDDGDGPRLPDSVIAARMRAYAPSGFDPRPYLSRSAAPALWIFGGRDESVPVAWSIAALEKIKREDHRDITIKRFPDGNHLQLETATGARPEYPLLRRFVPGYFDAMFEWLEPRILRPLPDGKRNPR